MRSGEAKKMVSVQHPAVAAAFWQAPSHNHHVFAFSASAQCGPLVPQWHHSSTNGSCVSVSSHALAGHHHHHHHHHTPVYGHAGKITPVASGGELGGVLGQALASSAAAFLPQIAPQPPPGAALSHVLMNAQSFASPVALPVVPQAIATLDPVQPIGYGSFGVVWYGCSYATLCV